MGWVKLSVHGQDLLSRSYVFLTKLLNRFVLLKVISVVIAGMLLPLIAVILVRLGIIGSLKIGSMAYYYTLTRSLQEAFEASTPLSFEFLASNTFLNTFDYGLVYILATLVVIFFMAYVDREKVTLESLGLGRRKDAPRLFSAGMLIIAALYITSLIVVSLILTAGFFTDPGAQLVFSFSGEPLAGIISSTVLAVLSYTFVAFGEEILFRGYVQKTLVAKYGARLGLLGAALIFAVPHLNPLTFFGGCLLGYLYLKTGSLWMSAGFHLVYDLIIFLTTSQGSFHLYTITASPPVEYLEAIILLTLLTLMMSGLYIYHKTLGKDKTLKPSLSADYPRYASFRARFAAFAIDLALILPLLFVAGTVLDVILTTLTNWPVESNEVLVIELLIMAAIWITYYAYFMASKRQGTPGNLIVGTCIVDKEGRRLSWKRALGRAVLKVISDILCVLLIGIVLCIPIAFTAKRQAVYDMIVGTCVLKGKAGATGTTVVTIPTQPVDR